VALVCSCSGTPGTGDEASGGAGPASGGSASGGSASGGSGPASGGAGSGGAGSGGTGQGTGGDGGGTTTQCATIDGVLAYGPIGERHPLSVEGGDIVGFPTSAGYGLVWRAGYDAEAPSPNLFGTNVDLDFQGGTPQAIPAGNTAAALDVVPAPGGGFVAATCSPESEPEWIRLSADLLAPAPSTLAPPDVPCTIAPHLVWTGERVLTSFVDARGLVVAALDAQGVLVGEEIISANAVDAWIAHFSRNGDRTLFVFNEENSGRGLSVVLDAQGAPLGDVRPFGKDDSSVSHVALTPSGDGWLVASDAWITNDNGLFLTTISRDGLVGPETQATSWYVFVLRSKASAYGGALVVGQADSGGQFGQTYRFTYLIDDAGQGVYAGEHDDPEFFPVGVIADPLRDLVIEAPAADAESQALTVQEYGCLE